MGFDGLNTKGPDAGAFGEVRRCIDTRTHSPRAVKHISKSNSPRDRVLNEIEVMRAVSGQHQNVVEFKEYFEEWNHFDLIFEFCENGTVDDAIKAGGIHERSAACFCHQLLSALAFLKKSGVLHRDVKPANVLLKDEMTSKLSDFGSACFAPSSVNLSHPAGTPAFFPPEVHILPQGDGYSFPADAWAAGITLYMMLFKGRHPFAGTKTVDTRLAKAGAFDAGLMWLWSGKAAQLLHWLLMPCPWQRAVPETACKHAWLGSHGFGPGSFSDAPPSKLVPDSYGRWGDSYNQWV